MSYSRIKPTYVTLSIVNNAIDNYDETSTPDEYLFAEITETYNNPVIDKASDYVCCIERMELSLNAIPFYDARKDTNLPIEVINIRSRFPGYTDNVFPTEVIYSAYSLSQLLNQLSTQYTYRNPNFNVNTGNVEPVNIDIKFALTIDGFIKVSIQGTDFNRIQIEFPRRLNMILGISTKVQPKTGEQDYCYSSIPRLDTGDDLQRIIITTNLPTNSDTTGNVRLPVMTDIGVENGSAFSSNIILTNSGIYDSQGWTVPLRDKLVYVPTERRFLDLNGDFPLNNIQMAALYVTLDKKYKKVPVAFGGEFSLKLGFYLKQ